MIEWKNQVSPSVLHLAFVIFLKPPPRGTDVFRLWGHPYGHGLPPPPFALNLEDNILRHRVRYCISGGSFVSSRYDPAHQVLWGTWRVAHPDFAAFVAAERLQGAASVARPFARF